MPNRKPKVQINRALSADFSSPSMMLHSERGGSLGNTNWIIKAALLVIAVSTGMIAVRPFISPAISAQAQSSRFDHVYIISPLFLYKGEQGLLVMDKRNANIWFIPRRDEDFQNPVFLVRLPFEKLDQAPQ
jgi:hypothetical protein